MDYNTALKRKSAVIKSASCCSTLVFYLISFQRFIDEVLRDLDFCYAYIDDILVVSTWEEEHEQHLRTLFQRFNEYGVLLNTPKCVFGATEVTFLGYAVSAAGTQPLEEKVAAIDRFHEPVLVKDLRRFLGMLNFYMKMFLESRKETADFLRGHS